MNFQPSYIFQTLKNISSSFLKYEEIITNVYDSLIRFNVPFNAPSNITRQNNKN